MRTYLSNPALAATPIDISKLQQASFETSPYDHVITSGFIRPGWQESLLAEYPVLEDGGSFPLSSVTYGASFAALIESMNSDAFRKAVEEKFSIDLVGKPTMFTVRGICRAKDGKVHTDSESKIITALLYMNPAWESQGGRLRLLRSNDVNDVAHEVSPEIGTLLVFRRSDNSFHGHLPFKGMRRVIQMNWVTHQIYADHEQKRHGWSSFLKGLAATDH